MEISRRRLLLTGGLGLAAALDPFGIVRAAQAQPDPSGPGTNVHPESGATTTLDATLVRGEDISNGKGYRAIAVANGEPHLLRTELTDLQTVPTIPLVAFVQLSDLHIIDDQSPVRLEFLDYLADAGPPHYHTYPTNSAYRAHEMLTTQIVEAMCRAVRKLGGKGPRTRQSLVHTIATGDLVDNAQFNETRWMIDLLDGGRTITPNSGHPTIDESVASWPQFRADFFSWNYWHPHGDAPYFSYDRFLSDRGFPVIPGLLPAARAPFVTTGLGMPWYSAYGNHDRNLQGNIDPFDPAVDFVANPTSMVTGSVKPAGLRIDVPETMDGLYSLAYVLVAINFAFDPDSALFARSVTADPNRRFLTRQQFINEHFNTVGSPGGHGYTFGVNKAYYEIPSPPGNRVKFLCLDTTKANDAEGHVSDEQIGWLHNQLNANSSTYYLLEPVELDEPIIWRLMRQSVQEDKLFIVYCHHTLDQIDNGDQLRSTLLGYPNVIALVNGHTHYNRITPHARQPVTLPYGGYREAKGGFWEINLASHVDWPCQGRVLELAAGEDVISIFTTMFDIDAPLSNRTTLTDPRSLAGLARELAANDPQLVDYGAEYGADGHELTDIEGVTLRGGVYDRNTQLLVPAPFHINAPAVPVGRVHAWGDDDRGQRGGAALEVSGVGVLTRNEDRFRQVAAGSRFGLALHRNGTIWAWGDNSFGQAAQGTVDTQPHPEMRSVQALLPSPTPTPTGKIIQVDAGDRHALALREDGTVFAWGDNAYCQLGDDSAQTRPAPVTTRGLQNQQIVQIAAGGRFSLAVDIDGRVWAWGNNSDSELGDGTVTTKIRPVLNGLTGVTQVSAGYRHALALKSDGTVWSWGGNANGQLGDGTAANRSTPARVTALSGTFIQVSAGATHSLALRNDGTVWAWGSNAQRELGDGTTTPRPLPVRVVDGLPGGILRIDAGTNGSGATDATQALWSWGAASNPARGGTNMQLCGAYGPQFAIGDRTYLAIGGELGPPLPPTATVPNLIGQTQQAATAALVAIGLHVATVANVIDNNNVGKVSATVPVAGTVLFATNDGGGVDLKIGSASPPVAVPNLNGLTAGAASQALQAVGLSVGLQFQVANCAKNGTVTAQNPSAGVLAAVGSSVAITVAMCPQGIVPDVRGLTVAAATTTLQAAGLVKGSTYDVFVDVTSDAGKVQAQSKAPGTPAAAGTAINLGVGKFRRDPR